MDTFFVFAYDYHTQQGGALDLFAIAETLEDAEKVALTADFDVVQIAKFNSEVMEVVKVGYPSTKTTLVGYQDHPDAQPTEYYKVPVYNSVREIKW